MFVQPLSLRGRVTSKTRSQVPVSECYHGTGKVQSRDVQFDVPVPEI